MPHYRWLGLALWLIAFALVAWTLSQMPLAGIGETLSGLAGWQWLVWLLVNSLVIIVSTWRWHLLSHIAGHAARFTTLLLIRQAGQTVSFITPGPQFGGEPFQIYWLHQQTGMAIHRAVLSLGLDRFYELWINFLMLLLGVSLLLSPGFGLQGDADNHWQQILVLMAIALIVLTALALAAVIQPEYVSTSLEKLSARWLSSPKLARLDDHLQRLGSDIRRVIATQRVGLLKALLLSLLVWVLIAGEMWLVLGFFDITPELSGLVLVLVAMRLALLLPLPGGVGTLEASIFWSFQLLDYSAAAALAVIAIMRLRDVLVLVIGLLCLRVVQRGTARRQARE